MHSNRGRMGTRKNDGSIKMKLLYFHVPKTAGSSINDFFADHIKSYHFHIESVEKKDNDFFKKYDFVSGHVSYTDMNRLVDLKQWITFATFREPFHYVVSHLKWVRKLADPGEEERLRAHPDIFQKIALKMTEFDFSSPHEIKKFIEWLESIAFYYFHNTQMYYMNEVNYENSLTKTQLDIALNNMRNIDFIGVQEDMDSFINMISYEFGWPSEKKPPYVNRNENNYGFDTSCEETKKALYPLYEKDLIIYKEAKKLFGEQRILYQDKQNMSIRGFVDGYNQNIVSGWVRFQESLKKVELVLKLNDQIIGKTTANIFRQDLKTQGIHPSGCCGFRFKLDGKFPTEKCKVYVKDTDIDVPYI